MPNAPDRDLRSRSGTIAATTLRVGALKAVDGSLGTTAMLLKLADLMTAEAVSVSTLVDLARNGSIAAVVVDPEMGEGWPIDTVEQIVNELRDSAPVIMVCGNEHDAEIIEKRIAKSGLTMLRHTGLTAEKLAAAVRGAVAAHSVRRDPQQPG